MAEVCKCVARHSPVPHELNVHHILPQSWGGKSTKANLVTVCPSTHSNVHRLLNLYVAGSGVPPREVLAHYSPFVRVLAKQAWDQRPNDKPPYTDQHGVIPNA